MPAPDAPDALHAAGAPGGPHRPDEPVVAITGASAGVGRATARRFAERGARVGLLARGRDGLEAARREVERAGGRALAVPTDVADAEQVQRAATAVEEALGPIDVWVNNAMTAVLALVPETSPAEFRRVTEVTYLGQVHGTLAALDRMLPRDRGTIVQVGSALAYRGIPLQATYCGAKHAMVGFTESLRAELFHLRSQVRVTMVHLPGLNTTQFGWVRTRTPRRPRPVAPVYQPEVAADAIVWAADHPGRRSLMVGAPTVATVWAGRLAGGLADRYLGRTNVEAQQTHEPVPADREDYLFSPVPGDHGAHGDFDAEAHHRSPQLLLNTHPRAAGGLAAAALGLGVLARWRRR